LEYRTTNRQGSRQYTPIRDLAGMSRAGAVYAQVEHGEVVKNAGRRRGSRRTAIDLEPRGARGFLSGARKPWKRARRRQATPWLAMPDARPEQCQEQCRLAARRDIKNIALLCGRHPAPSAPSLLRVVCLYRLAQLLGHSQIGKRENLHSRSAK